MAANINLNDLPVHQLQAIRQQIDQEIQILTQSFAQLRQAQSKFLDGSNSLKRLENNSDKDLLIPLTNSLYVPGKVADENVLLDVGTGYYIEKDIKGAIEYFKRKSEYIKGNLDTLQNTVNQKQNQRAMLMDALQNKLQELGARKS